MGTPLSRREFLRLAGLGLGAAALSQLPRFGNDASAAAAPKQIAAGEGNSPAIGSTKTAVQQTVETFQAHIEATDRAKDQYDVNRDLSEIPPNLFFASFQIAVYLKDPQGYAGQGTATIIEEDTLNHIAYGVAAGHTIEALVSGSKNAISVSLLQPHFGNSNFVVDVADIRAEKDAATDIGAFAIRYSGSFPIGSFGADRLSPSWKPSSQEPLFVLGYPYAAQKNKFLASELRLNDSLYGNFVTPEGLYVALSRNAGPGSSGELVVTADGYGIGVVKSIAKINGVDCILITPLKNQFSELKKRLVFA